MSTAINNSCRWCGMIHGPQCPAVKAIEFYEDGITVKRVEFKTAKDYNPEVGAAPEFGKFPAQMTGTIDITRSVLEPGEMSQGFSDRLKEPWR